MPSPHRAPSAPHSPDSRVAVEPLRLRCTVIALAAQESGLLSSLVEGPCAVENFYEILPASAAQLSEGTVFDTSHLVSDEGKLPELSERRVWRYELPDDDGRVYHYPYNSEHGVTWSQFATVGERWGWIALPGDAREQ